MASFLKRLAARIAEPAPVVRPRLASRFEPADAAAGALACRDDASSDIALDVVPSSDRAPSSPAESATSARAAARPAMPGSMSPPVAPTPMSFEDAASRRRARLGTLRHIIDASMQDAIEESPPHAAAPRRSTAPRRAGPLDDPHPTRDATPASTPPSAGSPRVPTVDAAVPPTRARAPAPPRPAVAASPRVDVGSDAAETSAATAVRPPRASIVDETRAPAALAPTRAVAPAMRREAPPPSPPRPAGAAATSPAVAMAASTPTVIEVTIGTLDVRAPAPPPRAARPAPRRVEPRLGLQEYLRRRDRKQRG